MLKQLYNLSDEKVVVAWVQNPYYQYFTGEVFFSWSPLATPQMSVKSATGKEFGQAPVDKGYRGKIKVNITKVVITN